MTSDKASEHLIIQDMRQHPDGEVRLYSADGKLISGTWARQVTVSIDAIKNHDARQEIVAILESCGLSNLNAEAAAETVLKLR